MPRIIVIERIKTCAGLEQVTGLKKGDILSITISPDKDSYIVEVLDSVPWPDQVLAKKISDALNLHVKN